MKDMNMDPEHPRHTGTHMDWADRVAAAVAARTPKPVGAVDALKARIHELELVLENLLNRPVAGVEEARRCLHRCGLVEEELRVQALAEAADADAAQAKAADVERVAVAVAARMREMAGQLEQRADRAEAALPLLSRDFWHENLLRHDGLSLDSDADRSTLAAYLASAVARALRGDP